MPLVSEKFAGSPSINFFRKPGVMEVAVGAVAFLAYLSTLSFGFIYDDKPVIVDNIAIRSWHSVGYYFTPQFSVGAPLSSGTFYRPVTLLWLRLNYVFFGLDPAGWHFAMVLCHVLMTYLVFLLVEKLSDNRSIVVIAAILFGLHPVHVENVAWLSSVNDLLMSVFLIGSFVAYLNYRDGRKHFWMGTSLILFSLGLLSKETAAVFPFLLFFFAAVFGRRQNAEGGFWSALKDGLVSTPHFVVLMLYLAARRLTLHGIAPPLTPVSWSTMILTAPSVVWFDLKHLLFPVSSSEFYSLAYITAPAFRSFVLPICFVFGSLAVAALYISKWPHKNLGFFALGLTFVPILPTLYLRAIAPANFVHDRFLYLPSVGIVILIALALERISSLKTQQIRASAMMWAAAMILCTAALASTVSHEMQWASNLLLYQNAIKYAPQNPVLQVNLGNEFAGLGHYDKALPLYLSALQNDPLSWLSNYNLGYGYYRTGRFPEAENYLKRATQIDDRDPDQFIYLALAEMERGELAQAGQNAERAIQRGPASPGFHLVLGKILEAGGDRNGAFGEYKAELDSHPDNGLARSEIERLQSSK